MANAEDVIELTKDLTVLYAEDDPALQEELGSIFDLFFGKIIVANDGEEGLGLYKEHQESIDLIISDIQMPNMDGLEMVRQIRSTNTEVPVIMITAFNDQEYFIKSINIKVDKYLLKPVDEDQMISTFSDIALTISEKKLFKQLLKDKQQRELKAKEQETISKISNAYTSPAAIFKEKKLVEFSKPFADLFDELDEEAIGRITFETDTLFDNEKGCMRSFGDYDEENAKKNKVQITRKARKKIFRVYKKRIDLDGEADMFIMINITLEEYLKVKIDSYVHSLERLVIKNKAVNLIPEKETVSEEKTEKDEKPDDDSDSEKLQLSDDKKSLLRKNHEKVRIAAADFIESIDPMYLKELQELDDLDRDLYDAIYELEEGNIEALQTMSRLFLDYAGAIRPVETFQDLYVVLTGLSDLLFSIDFSMVDTGKHKMFFLYINSVREDLAYWRKNVFVEQNADNIHYLDASLLSNALQIEVLLSSEEIEIEEADDFELF